MARRVDHAHNRVGIVGDLIPPPEPESPTLSYSNQDY